MEFAPNFREGLLLRCHSILNIQQSLKLYIFYLWTVLDLQFFNYCVICKDEEHSSTLLHTCSNTHTHMQAHAHTDKRIHTDRRAHASTNTSARTHVHTQTLTNSHKPTHIRTITNNFTRSSTHAHIRTHTCVHLRALYTNNLPYAWRPLTNHRAAWRLPFFRGICDWSTGFKRNKPLSV